MDEKHRQYCIKLGNPYMESEKYQKPYQYDEAENFWEQPANNNLDWRKNNKKFTNYTYFQSIIK